MNKLVVVSCWYCRVALHWRLVITVRKFSLHRPNIMFCACKLMHISTVHNINRQR